jgi:hypothetical protein
MKNLYIIMAFFAIPHLIDDFLFGIPDEFGISNLTAQVLAGVFIVIYLLIFWDLVLEKKRGKIEAGAMGLFLALAGILKHIPLIIQPGPYWSGWFSEGLIYGLIISGLILFVLSLIQLRSSILPANPEK